MFGFIPTTERSSRTELSSTHEQFGNCYLILDEVDHSYV